MSAYAVWFLVQCKNKIRLLLLARSEVVSPSADTTHKGAQLINFLASRCHRQQITHCAQTKHTIILAHSYRTRANRFDPN